jgi:Leucine-rich repeat (LRR) protein
MHKVQFPINTSLGRLYLRRESSNNWVSFCEAQGEVIVPNRAEICLKVYTMKTFDLKPLTLLMPNDIQALEIVCTSKKVEQELTHLRHLTGLIGLAIWETDIGDLALSYISQFIALRWLDIGSTKITDAGLEHLTSLLSLRALALANNQISDRGMASLERMSNLERLDLMNTRFSDISVSQLKKLKALKWLRISETSISERGYYELKQALPECHIINEVPK